LLIQFARQVVQCRNASAGVAMGFFKGMVENKKGFLVKPFLVELFFLIF
jgi:hypothetical protein